MDLQLNISQCELISGTNFQVSDVTRKSVSRILNLQMLHCLVLLCFWYSPRRGLGHYRSSDLSWAVERLECNVSKDATIFVHCSTVLIRLI